MPEDDSAPILEIQNMILWRAVSRPIREVILLLHKVGSTLVFKFDSQIH